MTGSGQWLKQTENEMMIWAAFPPARTDCLASKPITLWGSSLSQGVTGQTTSTHTNQTSLAKLQQNPFSRPISLSLSSSSADCMDCLFRFDFCFIWFHFYFFVGCVWYVVDLEKHVSQSWFRHKIEWMLPTENRRTESDDTAPLREIDLVAGSHTLQPTQR